MKVFLLGTDKGNYPSFMYQCKKVFENKGYEIDQFSYRSLKLNKLNITNKILNKIILKKVLKSNPDLLFVNKGESLNKGVISKISKQGIKTINWTLDSPFGDFYPQNKINNISEYNHFFVFDPFYLDKLKKINPNSYYLPCAADPIESHKQIIPLNKRNYIYDISFLGSYEPERVKFMDNLKEFKPHVWGHNWKISNNFILHKDYLTGEDMAKKFNQTKINLNIQALHGKESMNLRTFEIPASNGFQLVDYKKELPNLFKLDKEIVCYYDIDDLKNKIKYYLKNKEERDKITLEGHKRVLKDHKVSDRISEMLKISFNKS
jgi:spore maturation protein CgeB